MEETNKNENDKNKLYDDERIEKVKELRERLAKNMGTSNYFFYLESNIGTRTTRGL